MALRIAIPGLGLDSDNGSASAARGTISEARERRLKLAGYVEIDPAIRFVIALAIVAAISLLYLVQTSKVAEINYHVRQLETQHDQLIHDREDLQLQIAAAQSLPRIRDLATNQLGMVPVGDGYRYLDIPPANASGN